MSAQGEKEKSRPEQVANEILKEAAAAAVLPEPDSAGEKGVSDPVPQTPLDEPRTPFEPKET